jgi:peroxiredoxin
MRCIVFIVCVLSFSGAIAQTGYKIDFKIKEWKDTTVFLGHYFGESTYIKDTARVDSHGAFTFDGNTPLLQGVYFLVLNKVKIFDFIVGSNQHFSLETSSEDYLKFLKSKGDDDNRLFVENIGFNMEQHKLAEPFIKILQDTTLKDEQKKKEAREGFEKVNAVVIAFQRKLIADNPTTVTARILKATQVIEVPDPPKKADGKIDSSFQYRYYREHFFDNFDLADEALVRIPKPIYQEKVKEYLTKLIPPQPDSVNKAIDKIVAVAKKNQETYKYLVYTCVFLYQTPEIMGMDAVFIHVYDKYFATGEMDYWANAALKKNLREHAEKLGRAMIGKIGPNLMMQDQNLQPRSLYDIKKKYTIIFFFDPDCGHCRQESPKLVDFYNKNKTKYNLEVYAVSADTSLQKMKDYIKEMKMTWVTVNGPRTYLKENYHNLYYSETTPTLYILDENKKVIARKLPTDKIDDFLTNYEKYQKSKGTSGNKGT